MWSYVKEAFFVRARVPLLGGVPVNVLLAIAFGILGVAHPGFWLLGAGLIGSFVLMLTSSPRFRKWVNSKQFTTNDGDTKSMELALIEQLPPPARARLGTLSTKCQQIITTYVKGGAEDFAIDSSRDALRSLEWLYLKLLVAQASLSSSDSQQQASLIQHELGDVERDLKADRLSPTARSSREATREILLKRLTNLERRRSSLEEIDSDLDRIEAQIDLALDEATLKGQPTTLSTNIDLASQLLDSGVFGSSERLVLDLDKRFSPASPRSLNASDSPSTSSVPTQRENPQ